MNVAAKRVKRIVRDYDIKRVSYLNRWMVISDKDPDLAIVYTLEEDGTPLVITVLWRGYGWYERGCGEVRSDG